MDGDIRLKWNQKNPNHFETEKEIEGKVYRADIRKSCSGYAYKIFCGTELVDFGIHPTKEASLGIVTDKIGRESLRQRLGLSEKLRLVLNTQGVPGGDLPKG